MLDIMYMMLQTRKNKAQYMKNNLLFYKELDFGVRVAAFVSSDKRNIAIVKYEFGEYKIHEM